MAKRKAPQKGSAASRNALKVEGRVRLEALDEVPTDVKLAAFVFDEGGKAIGTDELDRDGKFSMPLKLTKIQDVQVVIGKAGDPEEARKSPLYGRNYTAKEWARRVLRPDIYVAKLIWWPWWPKRICVSGHVYKTPGNCPVPFVKVEVFDVDRLFCLWPYIYPLKEKLKPFEVVRVEDLLARKFERVERGPIEPLPEELLEPPIPPRPRPDPAELEVPQALAELGPQPEPPDMPFMAEAFAETKKVLPADLEAIADTTFTSTKPLWALFPRCFYSRQLLCTTSTDENGYWRCCFDWWPLQIRHGWLKVDWRPDIIIKLTQVIDGVEKVLYIDPYTNTRWNVTNAHIDVFVDDPDIECGAGPQDRPEGTQAFFTRIGNDEVYWIDQTTGLYEEPPWSNTAYGRALRVYAQFGDTLSRAQAIPGATAPYYYRLSFGSGGSFTPITRQLKDTRVHKTTLLSESHTLGPQTVGSRPALYEIRDFQNYYWYNPDWIALWITAHRNAAGAWIKDVPDGTYTLRLEVFDSTGTLLTSTKVDYRDGTVSPPAVLPALYPCDLMITIDNNPPTLGMTILPSPTGCGVIKAHDVPPLNVQVQVDQANGRLYRWRLQYTKGVTPGVNVLDGDLDHTGLGTPVNLTVDAMPMLAGVTTTCAFALKLWAWANVRNGYGLIWYREVIKAIAVERCGAP
jgi:hypothetical protein